MIKCDSSEALITTLGSINHNKITWKLQNRFESIIPWPLAKSVIFIGTSVASDKNENPVIRLHTWVSADLGLHCVHKYNLLLEACQGFRYYYKYLILQGYVCMDIVHLSNNLYQNWKTCKSFLHLLPLKENTKKIKTCFADLDTYNFVYPK
jgi:hypothetical protein